MSTLNSDKNDTTKPTPTTSQYLLSSRTHTDVHHQTPAEKASSGSSKTWTELQEDDPKQGRLSVVLCHQCQTLHYELMPCQNLSVEAAGSSRGLLPSSAGHRLAGDRLAAERRGERGVSSPCCRHSISWDEFFGSSLELAPSLLSIYDTLAAQDLDLQQQHNPHPAEEDPANLHLQNAQGHGVTSGQGQGQVQSCVTSASTGFWVTDRDSQQRLFVRVGGVGVGLSPGGLVSCSGLPPGLPPLPASGRPLSMMEAAQALKPEASGDKENVKKRPLSIGSLSSVSSSSRGRQQPKRPNLAQDPEGSASDHTSSDSNLTGPMSDRVSFTSDRASLTSDLVSVTSDPVSVTSDAVSLTSDFVSVTSDPVSLTSDAVSVTSAEDSGVGSKSATACSDREELESSVDPDGFKESQGGGLVPVLPGGVTSCGGDSSLELTPSGLQDQAPSISSVSSSSVTPNTPSNTVPDINVDSASTTTSLDNNSTNQGDSSPSCAGSSGDETSPRPPAVVMKPLHNTIRPVVISLPESIRKPRSGSSCVDGEKLPASSVPVRLEELAAGPRPALVTSLASRKTRITPAGGSGGGGGGGGVAAPGSLLETPVSKSVPSSTSSSPGGEDARSRILGMSPGIVSPTLSLSAPPFSPSAPRSPVLTTPVSPQKGSLPPQPFQIQAVSQQNSASPLSPTAIARRRFLASHFDIPDVPPLEEPPKETPGAEESEQPMDDGMDPASSAGVRSSTLKVPNTLSFRSDASLMSSPSPSPSSAMHSSCEEFALRGAEDSSSTVGRDVSPHPAERVSPTPASRNDRDVSSHPAEVSSASSPSSKKTSSPHQSSAQNVHPDASSAPACGSPPLPTRGRSHHRRGGAEGEGVGVGGGGKGGGSVKGGGSYVTYVQRVVTEVVETERVYVTSLEAIIKGYLEPLRALLVSSPRGQQDLACLFCNITDIYAFGQVFLADLEQCGLDPVKVAECFVKHNNGFVIYTEYCTNYPRAVEVLTRFMQDGELNEACKACQTRLGHGLPLGAFLLRPVQRILKYHLLLQNILKNFDKGRPGYSTLEQALGHMTAMAHHINEMKRRHEHAVRIQEVQSLLEDYSGEDLTRLGELVLEGSFRVYGAKASRQVFLFERGILITKKKEGGMLMCKALVLCSNLMLVEVIPNEPLSFHIIPFDNPRAQHTLQARSMEQKRHWCQEIKRLILESYKGRIPDNVKSLVMELGRNHDNDYVGKDTHDSPWKHQHTAPEYLEKRRFRRKSGGKGADVGPLLKFPKPGGKREQSAGNKSKSPRMWRRSDSKLTNGARERSESLPRMLASASSLPGLGAPASLRSESFRCQNSSSNSPSTAYITSDGNNNTQNKSFQSSDASPFRPDLDDSSETVQRRTSSFKRAMRFQPVFSQDLTDVVSKDVAMADDSVKMDYDSPATKHQSSRPEHQFIHTGHCDRSRKGRHELNNYTNSSPSVSEDSSDSDEEQGKPGKQRKERKKGSMYSSLPALHTLERRPAQKRRPGETKSGSKAKKDLSKSSDTLAGGSDKPEPAITAATHQYRRRWEGSEDGLESKVPAMHDSYMRHSRENLLRKKGKCAVDNKQLSDRKSSSGARLTDWGSVDKLTHGSMSDLSHLQEDPWVKLNDSLSQASSPRLQDTTVTATSTPNSHSRSRSMCVMESNDWNAGSPSFPGSGRPRNYSDVTQILQRPGKENLDWLVYVKRNIEDKEIRERANSLSKMTPNRSRTASGDLNSRTLQDSSPNIARSTSLCEDTLMRYSLDLPNRRQSSLSHRAGILASPRLANRSGGWVGSTEDEAAKDRAVTVVNGSDMSGQGHPPTPSEVSSRTPSFPSSEESPPHLPSESSQTPADVSQPPTSPPTTPRTSTSIQLLSPTPFSSKFQDASQDVEPAHPTSPPPTVQSSSQLSPGDHQQPCSPRPLSPHTEALSAEGDRMVAEMEKYYEINSPQTPVNTFKFPPTSQTSCASPTTTNSTLSVSDMNINRLSGVSSVSSTSNDGCVSQGVGHPPRDVNPNRLSGVSSISTSSYDSQNSNSSDSLVGTLKNKLSVWTTKLGGKKSREEEATHHHLSASRDSLSSPTPLSSNSDLQEVLREYSLGSPLIGSRMANTLPVGFEPLLSPQSTKDQTLPSVASKDETSRFSFPSAVPNHSTSSPEAFPDSVQQADSGISMYSGESTGARPHSNKARTLPPNMKPMQQFPDDDKEAEGHKRRDSASSTNSGDSFYERRLSVAFETSVFNAQTASGNQPEEPQSPEGRMGHRKSIREVVQFIEEKFRPQHPLPVEVKRKEPSALIRQRLQSLRDNSSYKRRASNRSVSEDRSRARERTPESPRLSRPENRSRSFNQFMHRVRPQSCAGIGRDRGREKEREREMSTKRELELASRVTREQGRENEERSEGGASSNLSAMGSMDRLDQLSSDVDSLVIMRGWVRSLINKFQQIT